MPANLSSNGEVPARARSVLPPYLVRHDFLPAETVAGLLDYALARQSEFAPTRLGSNNVDSSFRVSTRLRDLGGYREIVEAKMRGQLPGLIAELRMDPFQPSKLETELVAHGDGAFYKRHADTQTARYDEVNDLRVLSGVYYFHAEPKAFGGGALRLFAIGGGASENFVDVEPVRNSLLVFPSWAPHEVMPVVCPSRRFMDSRFAINCWVHRRKADAAA